jgi:hypothetical protein
VCLAGGVELRPVRGHLGSREPIVKPTVFRSVFSFFGTGGKDLGNEMRAVL